jgi:hypothetical protein
VVEIEIKFSLFLVAVGKNMRNLVENFLENPNSFESPKNIALWANFLKGNWSTKQKQRIPHCQ